MKRYSDWFQKLLRETSDILAARELNKVLLFVVEDLKRKKMLEGSFTLRVSLEQELADYRWVVEVNDVISHG